MTLAWTEDTTACRILAGARRRNDGATRLIGRDRFSPMPRRRAIVSAEPERSAVQRGACKGRALEMNNVTRLPP